MATNLETDYKVADISLAAYGRKEIQLAEHEIGLSDIAFASRLRRDPGLRGATEAWLEAKAERPDDVPVAEWMSWEQQKHQKLLAAAAQTATPLTTTE